ncbi:GFA family protein [Roseomonas sp. CCTCC AB2023176]|uniref:GFA family protein n=1 Tax=Roseomonas sp. CCTCC AB2023176 TaxID=3342640 RepID=UPI0035D557CC
MDQAWDGRCNCGAVRIAARGAPLRAGLCHCLTCQRETGGPCMAFAVWRAEAVTVEGETREWGENAYRRRFCAACGSRVTGASAEDGETEVRLGVFEGGGRGLVPEYELWVIRRQGWMAPVPGARQYERERE